MVYCLNPDCERPQNPNSHKFCHSCGKVLAQTAQSYDFLNYRVVKLIGQGGFARTYKAIEPHKYNKRPCVVKKLTYRARGSELAKIKELFAREAEQLEKLNHPQIPRLYAYFEYHNSMYLVQEFIEGENLRQELKHDGPFSEAKIREILQQLLPVLKYLHSKEVRVLHRDIKPANIMRRGSDGKLLLIDFGGAKKVTGITVDAATVLYTPGYAPIEQMRGRPTKVTDIYSLGATVVRLLTGCLPPKNGPDPIYDEDNNCWTWREYCKAKGLKPISEELGFILDGMLEHLPTDRYQPAAEVLVDLNKVPNNSNIIKEGVLLKWLGYGSFGAIAVVALFYQLYIPLFISIFGWLLWIVKNKGNII